LITRTNCPNCGGRNCEVFYSVANVPTNSCLLVLTREDALRFPTADIELSFCPACGFIFNRAWEASKTTYSEQYEETQGFSGTFNTFHRHLAEDLIRRHALAGKDVLEIGCGKGEFLTLLCKLGHNRGVGYDPSFVPERAADKLDIRFVQKFFGEGTVEDAPDLLCCKMTLEHILETSRFIAAVRAVASPERGTVVFFQIPDVRRILAETAFWDIYYEHCSYFSPNSLAHLFRSNAFKVLDVWTGYDDQYLMIEARPVARDAQPTTPREDGEEVLLLASYVAGFSQAARQVRQNWGERLRAWSADGRKVVLWGSGSKAVAFLTTIGITDEIEFVVDINPYRQGKFIPGTGQQIVGPEFLQDYRPDLVIVMNPIYRDEIERELRRNGSEAELIMVNDLSHATDFGAKPISPVREHHAS
jgi:2-polyprenyl-3-methyl-5-hydroxy-6-metoxy-1,4-benzoquinol methylase